MYRRRRRAELRHGGAGSGSGGSVANQLGGASAEPSWSMEAEAEAAEQSMLTPGPWPARVGPRGAVGRRRRWCRERRPLDFISTARNFTVYVATLVGPGLVRESC